MRPFLDHAMEMLGPKAHACAHGTEGARIEFLAHLFVICTFLQEADSSAAMRTTVLRHPARPVQGWADVPSSLQSVPVDQPEIAYECLMALLLQLEKLFRWTIDDGERPPMWTVEVSPISAGERGTMRGTVRCWLRPPSALRKLIGSRPGPAHYQYRPIDQLQCLGMLWESDQVPWLRPVPWPTPPAPALIEHSGQRLGRRGCFRIALCPLIGSFWPRFAMLSGLSQFAADTAEPMHAPQLLTGHLDRLIDLARDREIDVLVLPELTVDAQALTRLKQRLGTAVFPHAVVAGSFHVMDGDSRRNRAPILDQNGRTLWSHDKRGHFRVTGSQMHAMARLLAPGQPRLFSDTPPSPDRDAEYFEGIQHGDTLHILDAPLGRLAVLICADALDLSGGYRSLVHAGSIDLLLIIGMSGKTSDFWRWAEDLRRLRTVVLFVNAGCLLQCSKPNDVEALAAFMCLPWSKDRHPVRVRWRHGTNSLEVLDDKEGQAWVSHPPDGDALTLLPEGLGLVVNLGAWWREAAVESGRKVE
jgi:predicted amidohydrolase